MADGFICAHCGKQETVHELQDNVIHEQGYHFSVINCPGFKIRKIDEAAASEPMHTESELKCLENIARGRAGWGAYSAHKRQQGLDEKIASAKNDKERKKIIAKAVRQNSEGFYVG